MLVKLRGQLHEIARDTGTRNRGIGDIGKHAVQRMAEFVEERAGVVDRQKRRLALGGFREVADIVHDRDFAGLPFLSFSLCCD